MSGGMRQGEQMEHIGKDGRSHFRVTGGNCACGWTVVNELEWTRHLQREGVCGCLNDWLTHGIHQHGCPLAKEPAPSEEVRKLAEKVEAEIDHWCDTGAASLEALMNVLTQLLSSALGAKRERVLTFEEFSRINRQRCEAPDGFNHKLESWSTSDWFLALLGELGEAANIAKKLNRVRDGIPGNKLSEEELRAKLRQEVGDTFVYLDLLCQACGISLCEAAVEVFNAKSAELGCPITIRALAQKGSST